MIFIGDHLRFFALQDAYIQLAIECNYFILSGQRYSMLFRIIPHKEERIPSPD